MSDMVEHETHAEAAAVDVPVSQSDGGEIFTMTSPTTVGIRGHRQLYTDVLHLIYEFLTMKELLYAGLTNRPWMVAVGTLKSRRFMIKRCANIHFLPSFILPHITSVSFNQVISQADLVLLATQLTLEELSLQIELTPEGVANFVLPPHLVELTISLTQSKQFLVSSEENSKSDSQDKIFTDEEKDEIIRTSLMTLMEQLPAQTSSVFTTLILRWKRSEYPHMQQEIVLGECLVVLAKISSLTCLSVPLPYGGLESDSMKEDVIGVLQMLTMKLQLKELTLQDDWSAGELALLTGLGETVLPLTDIGFLWTVEKDYFEPLRKLPFLTILHIDEVEFEDATQLLPYLPHLTFLQFRVNEYYLDCDVNLLVTALTTCKNLQSFYIRHEKLDVDHITKFLEPMTQLTELRLMTGRLSSFAFLSHHPHLALNLTLVELNWKYTQSKLPITELNHLHGLRQLHELILSNDPTLTTVINAEMTPDSPQLRLDHWPKLRTFVCN